MKRSILLSVIGLQLCILAHCHVLKAATVAFWSMQGTAGQDVASLLDSSGNNLHGTGAASNGGAYTGVMPMFDTVALPGGIYDPVSGSYYDSTSSIRFTNTGLPTANNTTAGSVIRVTHSPLLELQNFTVEGFIRINNYTDYATIIGKTRSANNPTYTVDTNGVATHAMRMRADHQFDGSPAESSQGWNQGFSSTAGGVFQPNEWYHIAFTFQEGDSSTSTPGKFQLYVNGVNVTSGSGNLANGGDLFNLVYGTGDLTFGNLSGGRAFDGWMSYFRITDTVLAPNQFLQIVPEPSKALLCLMSLGLLVFSRRR